VGLKRRDLVQLFTYEGTIYAFLAAIVGTLVGVGLSFGLVFILKDLIDTDDFAITPYYSIISLLISFSSGLILTFITVVFSAYRASNLNIVVAIRGLKDEFVKILSCY
ncbi:MAG: FtsX-like permease family protein, partial [SAR202 cluster bacterium]|nr:FtsX-like permease family protein [SAR202 cluster bacterium]